jgi:D-aspartate ligase
VSRHPARTDVDLDPSVPVVVFRLVRDYFAHGSLGVVRTLGRQGIATYCLAEHSHVPIALSRFAGHGPSMPWPSNGASSSVVLPDLLALGRRIGGKPVLIPTDDVAAIFASRHADRLREVYRYPATPGLAEQLSNKHRLHELCVEHGFPTPRILVPDGRQDLDRCRKSLGLPLIVKSVDPILLRQRAGAPSVVLAQTEAELRAAYDQMQDPAAPPNVLLQEYVPRTRDGAWNFQGYFDERSACLTAFTGQKIRSHPRLTGATSFGICRDNPELSTAAQRFMHDVAYQGIVDLCFCQDPRDGQYKLLDANPRVGSNFRLLVDPNGLDVVTALYRDLTGQRVPERSPVESRRWWVEPFDVREYGPYRRAEGLGVLRWLASVSKAQEAAWFAWDDPMPFLGMCGLTCARVCSRGMSRWNARGSRRAPGG